MHRTMLFRHHNISGFSKRLTRIVRKFVVVALVFVSVFALFPLGSFAAISLDAKSGCYGTSLLTTNPGVSQFTLAATAKLVVLNIHVNGTTARTGGAPTYGGVTMTQASTTAVGGEGIAEMWYLPDPPTGRNAFSIPNSNTRSLASTTASFIPQTGYSIALDKADTATNASTGSANPGMATSSASGRVGTTTFTTTVNGDALVGVVTNGLNSWAASGHHVDDGGAAPASTPATNICDADVGTLGYGSEYYLQPTAKKITMGWGALTSNWGVVVAAFKEYQPKITLSGRIYTDEGTTQLTALGKTVMVRFGTSTPGFFSTSTVAANGFWQIPNIVNTGMFVGMPIHTWIDGDETFRAFTFTKASSTADSANITGLDLYQNYVRIEHEAYNSGGLSTSTTIADLGVYDGASNSSIRFSTSSGALNVWASTTLYVAPGTIFRPGGAVTIHGNGLAASDGNLRLPLGPGQNDIATSSMLDMGANALTLAGSWFASSTSIFTQNGTVTFNSTSSAQKLIVATSSPFYALSFNGSGGSWTFGQYSATTTSSIDMTAGTITAPSTSLSTAAVNFNRSGVFVHNSGTVIFNSGVAQNINSTFTGSNAFNNVEFTGAGTKSFGANAASTTNFIINSSSGTVTAPSTMLSIAGGYTNNGTFSHNGGTVWFSSTTAQTLSGAMTGSSAFASTTFYGSGTKTFSSNASTTANFTIDSGATVVAPASLTIGGNYTNNGTFNAIQTYLLNYVAGRDATGDSTNTSSVAINALVISGNYAYVGKDFNATACSQTAGSAIGCEFMVFDITDPTNPVYVAGRDSSGDSTGTGNASIYSIAISGNYAYVGKSGNATACSQTAGSAIGCELMVFDITTQTNPIYSAGRDASGDSTGTGSLAIRSIAISGNYAYVGRNSNLTACSQTAGSAIGCELMVFDITTQTNPIYSAGRDASGDSTGTGDGSIYSIAISGNYAYVVRNGDLTACSQTAGSAIGCELMVFDITTPTNPIYSAGRDESGNSTGTGGDTIYAIAISGNYAYIGKDFNSTACSQTAGSATGCEFMVFDITTPTNPIYSAGRDGSGNSTGAQNGVIYSIAISGNYAYVGKGGSATACSQTAGSATGCEFMVFDITTPTNPIYSAGRDASGDSTGTGSAQSFSIAISGNYAYVGKGGNGIACSQTAGSASGCEFTVFDLGGSRNPVVTFSSSTAQTLSGTMTGTSAFASTTFIGSGIKTFSNNASTTGSFTINLGATVVAPALLSIAGNYTNNGTFTNNSGLVYLSGTAQQTAAGIMTGMSAFDDLTILNTSGTGATQSIIFSNAASTTGTFTMAASTSAQFLAGATTTFTNISLNGGSAATPIWLRSSSSGSPWWLVVSGSPTASYVNVKDSYACGGSSISASNWTDVSGNSCWNTLVNLNLTFSGRIFTDEGTTQLASVGKTLMVRVGTSTAGFFATSTIAANGFWQIPTINNSGFYLGMPVHAWIDGDSTFRAFTFTKASSTNSNITGLDLYKDYVIVKHEGFTGTSTTIADLGVYDGASNSSIRFSTSSGALNVWATSTLYIAPGTTFAPGGAITLHGNKSTANGDGDLRLATGLRQDGIGTTSILTMGGNFISVAGNWFASSTSIFTHTGTANFNSSSTQQKSIIATSSPFFNLQFNGPSGGSWTFGSNPATTTSQFNLAFGSVTAPSSYLSVGGIFSRSGTFNNNNGTTTFYGTSGNQTIQTMIGANAFNNVEFTGAGAKSFGANAASTTNFVINASSGTVTLPSTQLTISGDFTNASTTGGFAHNSGTVWFSSTTAQTLSGYMVGTSGFASTTFYGSGTKTFANNASTSANLTIASGATVVAPTLLTVGGNYTQNGSFTAGAGTVYFSSSTDQTLSGTMNTAATDFNHVQFLTGGTKTLSANASTTDFVIGSGVTVTAPALLSVAGNYTNSGTFTDNSGLVYLSGTAQQTAAGSMIGTSAFQDLTILNTSGTGGTAGNQSIIFSNAASTTGTFTMAASTSAQFPSGTATSSFANIVWNGTAASPIWLRSSSAGTPWGLVSTGTQSVSYVNVQDSYACAGSSITDTNGTDATGSSCWSFPQVANITLSGRIFTDEGTTQLASVGKTLMVRMGTSTAGFFATSTVAANGFWQIQNITNTGMFIGMPVHAWIDGDTTFRAFTFTKASSTSGNITGLDLYKDYVIVKHEGFTGTSTTNADLGVYDADNNSSIRFTSNAGVLKVRASSTLYIAPGSEFKPGGAVNLYGNAGGNGDGDVRLATGLRQDGVASSSIFTAETNNIQVSGNWLASSSAIFTQTGGSTLFFQSTSSVQKLIIATSSPFQDLYFTKLNGADGSWTFDANPATTTGSLTLQAGVLTAPSTNLAVGGDFIFGYNANNNFKHNNGTIIFNGASAQTVNGMSGVDAFNNVEFTGAGTKTLDYYSSTTNFIINSSSGAVTAPSTQLTISGNYTNNGTFAHNQGAVYFGTSTQTATYVAGRDISGDSTGTGSITINSIAISGNYAYVGKSTSATACSQTAGSAEGCEFQVYDITDPTNPIYVAGRDASGDSTGTGSVNITSIAISGNYAYVGKNSNATACSQTAGSAIGCELMVFDISTPTSPTYIAGRDASGDSTGTGSVNITSIAISGNYAYVGKYSNTTACSQTVGSAGAAACELMVFDISTPTSPTYVAGRDASGDSTGTGGVNIQSIAISGNYAYVGKANSSTACSQTAGSAIGCELMVFDISTPTSPTYVAGRDVKGDSTGVGTNITINSIAISGSYAYIVKGSDATACSQTAGSAIGCELMVFDISTPTNPTYVAGRDASGDSTGTGGVNINSIAISGNYAYVGKNNNATACSQSAGSALGCELMGFDISNPLSPTYVAGRDASGDSTGTGSITINSIAISGNYAYVGKNNNATACSQTAGSATGCELMVFRAGNALSGTMTGTSVFNTLNFVGKASETFLNNASTTANLSIESAFVGTVSAPKLLTVGGNYANSTTTGFFNNSGTVWFSSSTAQTLSGIMTGASAFASTTFYGAGTKTFANNASTTNHFVIDSTSGAVTAPALLSIAGNYTNNGTFANNNGLVYLSGTAQQTAAGTMTGTSAFKDLTILNTSGTGGAVGAQSIVFAAAASTTGTFTMAASTSAQFASGTATSSFANIFWNGTSTSPIWLRSSSAGTPWGLVSTGTQSVSYVNVKDSYACAGNTITVANSTDATGNSCWTFLVPITLSGRIFTNEGTTQLASVGKTLMVRMGTSTAGFFATSTIAANGFWQIPNITNTGVFIGMPVHAWIDGDTTFRAFTFTKASSTSGNITGLDLYQNYMIVKHEGFTGTSTTNADLGVYDGDDNASIRYTSNANVLNVWASSTLYIAPGTTFAPGGAVTLRGNAGGNGDGDLRLATGLRQDGISTSSILTMGSNTLTLAGNWFASSTAIFTQNTTGYVLFNSTSTAQKQIVATSSPFYELDFSGTGGSWTFGSNAATTTDFFQTTIGSITAPSTYLSVGGDFISNSAATFTHNSGTTVFYKTSGSQSIAFNAPMIGTNALNHVEFRGAGTKSFGTNAASTTNFVINSSSGTVTAPSTQLTISGNYTNNGTFAHNNGTVYFSTTSPATQTLSGNMTGSSAFASTTFIGSGTKTFSSNASTTNNFTINSGATVVAPTLLTVGGNYTQNGTFTAGAGTVYFSSSTSQTLSGTMNTAATTFNHVQFLTGGTKTLSVNASTTDFTIGSGVTLSASTLLSIAGNYTNNGTFTHNQGAVYFGTSTQTVTYVAGRDVKGNSTGAVGTIDILSIAISGNYAYVGKSTNATACSQTAGSAEGCEFQVYDITDPTNPIYVAGRDASGDSTGTGGVGINSIAISGNYAYVGKGVDATACSQTAGSAIGCEFMVFDVSSPANPTYVAGRDSDGSASGTLGPIINSIAIFGNYAYVGKSADVTACSQTAGSADGCELMVFDISNPLAPTYVAGRDASGDSTGTGSITVNSIAISGNYTYVGKGLSSTACSQTAGSAIGCEFMVFDISNPLAPTYVAGRDASGSAAGTGNIAILSIAISGNYAYVGKVLRSDACSQTAGSAIGCEFMVFDISTPTSPTYVAGRDASGDSTGSGAEDINSIAISGNYAYVGKGVDATACSQTAGSAIGCEFMVFDVTSPTNPVYVAGRDSDGSASGTLGPIINSIAIFGNYAYVGKSADVTACSQTAGSADGCELMVFRVGNTLSGTMTGTSTFNTLNFIEKAGKTFLANASTSANLSIDVSSGIVHAPNILSIGGNYSNATTSGFFRGNGTLWFSSSTAQTLSGIMTGASAFASTTFYGAGTKTFANNASTTNHFVIDSTSGAVIAPALLSIAGNYTNNGTFTHNNGTTTFNGTVAQILSGNMIAANAFKNLEFTNTSATTTFLNSASTTNFFASTSGVHLEFAPGATTSVYGNFVVHGVAQNPVNLFSTTNGSPWYIYASSTTAVTYVNIKDSNACTRNIDVSDGTSNDRGGNTCWIFTSGGLTLISLVDQTFTVGDASTAIAQITIADAGTPVLTAANDLRIAIATSTTFMRWDTSITGATFSGTACANPNAPTCKVSTTTLSYEGGGSVLLIPITSDFSSSDTLIFSGLNFMTFATASAPVAGLKIFKDGPSDQTADASNSKTITIKGLTAGAEHAALQFTNQIDVSGVNLTGLSLYAFNLMAAGGESMNVTNLTFNVSGAQGIAASDITNAKVYIDYNANKVVDAGDTQVGGAGAVTLTGQTGTIIFTSAFTATTTRDYILQADIANVGFGDGLTIALTPSTITAAGLTSLLATTPTSTVALSSAKHSKIPRGGNEVGSTAPTGAGIVTGGGQGGGAPETTIGGEPGFFPPTTTGGSFAEWSTASNGYLSDNTYATAATSWFRQDYGGFGFNVPSTNTISGIEVKLELSGSTAAGTVSVALSWDGGTSTTTIKTSPTLTTADAVVTLGGVSDTWGRTWTPAQLADANFKVRLVAQPSSNTVKIDAIQVNVHNIATGGGQGGGGEARASIFRNLASVYQAGHDFLLAGSSLIALVTEKVASLFLTIF